MRAVVITRPGGPEVLELRDLPQPVPAAGEVLVRIRATAVNRADLLQRAGRYPAPPGSPADIPGLEFAGEIAAIGTGVGGWKEGDRVFGIAAGGTYAEFVTSDARLLVPIPSTLGWEEAAAVPEAFITAHDALVTQAELARGETVLIHAVGSGVGLAGVQVVRWRGAEAYGTTRTESKLAAAREHGLAGGVVVGREPSEFVDAVRRWRPAGVDVIMDLVGGGYVPAGLEALAERGRLIVVGTVAGQTAELHLGRLLRKRATIRGTVLRARSVEEKAAATAAFSRDLLPAFESGVLHPVVHRVLPLEEVRAAHGMVAADENTGKVVLRVA